MKISIMKTKWQLADEEWVYCLKSEEDAGYAAIMKSVFVEGRGEYEERHVTCSRDAGCAVAQNLNMPYEIIFPQNHAHMNCQKGSKNHLMMPLTESELVLFYEGFKKGEYPSD